MKILLSDILTVFMVLFAVIDITGSIPIIIDLKRKTSEINALKTTLVAYGILLIFLFLGEPFLHLFGVDVSSFAIAGSLVLFFIGLEMVLGIEFFKTDPSNLKESFIVPIAFPLLAGSGTMTTIITLKAEYNMLVIFIALTLNMIVVYFVLRTTHMFEKLLGSSGILILKKIFGIILLAISIRLFLSNTGIKLHGI